MISCLAPVLGRSLDLGGPGRDAFEAEANQVGKEKRATRTAWSATVPRDSTARHPRQQRPSIDQPCAPDFGRRKDLWGPTARRLNIQPPTGGQPGRATFGWWDRPLVVVADGCRRLCSASMSTEGVSMALEVGKRVAASPSQPTADPAPVSLRKWFEGIRRLGIGSVGTTATRASTRPPAAPSGPNNAPSGNGERQRRNAHQPDPRRSTARRNRPDSTRVRVTPRSGGRATKPTRSGSRWVAEPRLGVEGPPGCG